MTLKSFLRSIITPFISILSTAPFALKQPIPNLLLAKIALGLTLIDLLVEPLMHFFVLKKYFWNRTMVTFILYTGTLWFLVIVAFPNFISGTINAKLSYCLVWALFSSIIRNIMYYTS